MIIARLQGFYKYRHLFQQLVEKDIKLRYRRSFLGYLWSVLNPLMIMAIMVLVFSNIFRFDIVNYPVYLIIGQTLFNFVQLSTNEAMWSIVGNAPLLKKTYVPKYIFTVSKVSSACVNYIFSLGAMLIVFFVCRVRLSLSMLWIPAVILQVYIFSVGMGLFLSATTVFFRDIQHIYAAFCTAWMYATPIFYPIGQLPENLQRVIKLLNPLYSFIYQFRTVVLDGVMPDVRFILYGFLVAGIMLAAGTLVFLKTQDKFILYI